MHRTSAVLLFLAVAVPSTASRAQTITFIGDRGGSCTTFGGTVGGTLSFSVSGAVATGSTLVMNGGTSGNASLMSISDSKGNTYTGVNSFAVGGVGRVFQAGGSINNALTGVETFTLTFTTSTSGETACATIHAFSNVGPMPGAADATGNASGNSATPGSTLGSTTSQPNELLVHSFIINGLVNGLSSPDLMLQIAGTGNPGFNLISYYRIVNTTGAFSMSANIGSTTAWQSIITSFRDVVVPVRLQGFGAE